MTIGVQDDHIRLVRVADIHEKDLVIELLVLGQLIDVLVGIRGETANMNRDGHCTHPFFVGEAVSPHTYTISAPIA